MPFARGFKTRCENLAETVRKDLALQAVAALAPELLASYLSVRLIEPKDIPGLSQQALDVLLRSDNADWSALTLGEDGSNTLIIFNPAHSAGRRASDLSHEMAHLLLRHVPSTLMFSPDGTWTLRSFDGDQEEEANWLAGCLLLPRVALLSTLKSGLSEEQVAERYGVSTQMVRYRGDVTGVKRQYAAGARLRATPRRTAARQ